MAEISEYIIGQLLIPYLSFGLVIAGFFLFLNTVSIFPERRYFSVLFITTISLFYLLFEILIKQSILLEKGWDLVIRYDQAQSVTRLFYLVGIPFFLHEFIFINPFFNRLHRLLLVSSIGLTLLFLTVAILNPDWYILYKDMSGTLIETYPFATIRQEATQLYLITEGVFFIFLIYTFTVILINMMRNPKATELKILLFGSLLSTYFFIAALWKSLFGEYLPPLQHLNISRVNAGLGLLTFFIYLGIFRFFLKRSKEVADTKDQLFKSQKELIRMAYTDELTQIGNRFAYMKELETQLKKKQRSAVLQMDIDHFMDLNESYGPLMGDQILKILAKRFKENLPPFVKIFRTGGDEFTFIITQVTNEDTPVEIAILLQNWMNQGLSIEGENYNLDGSLGICYVPEQGDEAHIISKNLNSALKTAKIRGKRIEVFNKNLHHQSINRIYTVQALKRSIKENDFYLVYQPILNSDQQICSAEALLRWKTQSTGYHSPAEFIPIAETAGLMVDLGNVVFELFIKDYREMKDQVNDLTFSINISPTQFYSSTLCDQLLFLFTKNDIPLDILQFEITESLFMDQWNSARETIQCFRSKGIKIALDDFGTGFSSLRYLQELPVDILKVDKSFLHQIPKDPRATTLLRTILNLASTFNMKSIAEGVEKEEQFRFLKSEGCDLFQGYHFHHPLSKEAFIRQLENRTVNPPPKKK